MAFPTIADADTKNGTVTSNSSSWTLTYPTNIAAGDLLLAIIATDGNHSTSVPSAANWTTIVNTNSGGASSLLMLAAIAAGTETGTFTLTLAASEQGGWRIFRIPASSWYGSGLPTSGIPNPPVDIVSTSPVNGTGLAVAYLASAGTANANPPSLDPVSWATEDTLWVAACAVDTSRTFSTFPTSYTNTASDVSGGAGGASLGTCRRENAASSEDPATFVISTSDEWTAATIGIRPAAGGAATNANAGVATGSGAAI